MRLPVHWKVTWRQRRLGKVIGTTQLRCAMLCGSLVVVSGLGGCAAPEPYHPNVIVVLIDALRADSLGVNGYHLPTTPRIDALAAGGVSFTRAYAHSTWTKPSIASLFTSTYPVQHGMNRVAFVGEEGWSTDVLAEDLVTMAERFSEAGYATAAAVNQPHLKRRFGFAQGFDLYRELRGAGAYKLNWEIQTWLGTLDADQPFFAYLHYLDAHWPYTKRLRDAGELFGSLEMERSPPGSGQAVPGWLADGVSDPDMAALRARYDQEIAWVDRALGAFWDWLEEHRLTDDLVLVVTSDHGEGFLEHGELLHGHAPYEEQIRVPLVVRLPARLASTRSIVSEPVGIIDLLPSLLDLADLAPETGALGRSFRPLLAGSGLGRRTLFAETDVALAAIAGVDKLLRFTDGRREFFDLAADPQERHPTAECGERCRELARALRTYLELPSYAVVAAGAELSAEEIEDLRALGYLD